MNFYEFLFNRVRFIANKTKTVKDVPTLSIVHFISSIGVIRLREPREHSITSRILLSSTVYISIAMGER